MYSSFRVVKLYIWDDVLSYYILFKIFPLVNPDSYMSAIEELGVENKVVHHIDFFGKTICIYFD